MENPVVANLPFRNGYANELFLHSNFMVEMAMHKFIHQRAGRFWQKHKFSSDLTPLLYMSESKGP